MAFEFGEFSEIAQSFVRDADARINIAEGAVRSGKTVSSIMRWIKYVRKDALPGNLLMAGKTQKALKQNILDPIELMVGKKYFKLNRGMGELELFGRAITLASASDESSAGKIQGLTLAGAYGDELALWPASFFKQLMLRLSVPGAKFFGTTNPDGPFHWLKTDYLNREDELNLKSFHFSLDDNPNLPPEYVADLKREYTGLWYQRFIEGLWVMAEGVIYPMFNSVAHVVDILPANFERYIVGVDYGTVNPSAFLLLGLHVDTWYVVREYYHDSRATSRQKTDSDYALDMVTWLKGIRPSSIEVDPSAASFITELRRAGINGVLEADNEVLEGIQAVSMALANQELLIHSGCKNLIRELASYSWDPKAQERGEDKPLKKNDHAADALRYASMRAFRGAPLVAPSGLSQTSYWTSWGEL